MSQQNEIHIFVHSDAGVSALTASLARIETSVQGLAQPTGLTPQQRAQLQQASLDLQAVIDRITAADR